MSKVFCGELTCKYNNDNYECEKKKINLSRCSVNTLYQDKQDFLKCNSYKERNDKWYKNAKDLLRKIEKEER